MLEFETFILLFCSLATSVIVGGISVLRARMMTTPKLIPVNVKPYSSTVSHNVASEVKTTEAPNLVEWARTPEECSYNLGYLATLPNNQSTPKGCFKCFKLTNCFDSWKTSLIRPSSFSANILYY